MTTITAKAVHFNVDVSVQPYLKNSLLSETCSTNRFFEPIKETDSLLKIRSCLNFKEKKLKKILDIIEDFIWDYKNIPLIKNKKNHAQAVSVALSNRTIPIATYLRSLNRNQSYTPLKPLITAQINNCLFIAQKMLN